MPLSDRLRHRLILLIALLGAVVSARAQQDDAPVDLIISIPEQKMLIVREGGWVRKYRVSTSRFGVGDSYGSYKTPVGRLKVYEKLGSELVSGAVIKHRAATGEILQANSPGRDPIVSRILWLEGTDGQNDNAKGRGIYIHGTNEEAKIGKPVSWGCIRMRSQDVIELYDLASVGTNVLITEQDLPRLSKWKPAPPPPPVIIAAKPSPPPVLAAAKPAPAPKPTKLAAAQPKIASAPLSRSEATLPVVAELLRPNDETPARTPIDASSAMKGSILFAGLPDAPKAVAKPAAKPLAKQGEAVATVLPESDPALSLRSSRFQ